MTVLVLLVEKRHGVADQAAQERLADGHAKEQTDPYRNQLIKTPDQDMQRIITTRGDGYGFHR